ncbi:hypothetical protein ACFQH6_10980 [Halobacteriaceae archaeon GCM10025711]
MASPLEFGLELGTNAAIDDDGCCRFDCPRCGTASRLVVALDDGRCPHCGLGFGGVAVRIDDPTYSRDQLVSDMKGRVIE